jgi:ubiquinone/menaquinone biosynthesis C-methylase UbiE
MNKKGNEFKGLAAGANYKRMARIFGFGEEFYRKGIGNYTLEAGMKAIDLGCGPGALSFALAETACPDSEITGIDISEDQLAYAKKHSDGYDCKLNFIKTSMDDLPFEDNSIDIVVSSMALHETPASVRRAAVNETARVLKNGGVFIFVDWSKSKFGLWGIIWYPLVRFGETNKDNWNNVYPSLCGDVGLSLIDDYYINSITRRQVFWKQVI